LNRSLTEHDTRYATIVADPDWQYENFGLAKHGAARAHYPGSAVEEISKIPVKRWAKRDAILFLWATLPKLDQAIAVMHAWDFRLVTAIPWVKTQPKKGAIKHGIGFWFYTAAELVLVCRAGKARAPKQGTKEKPDALLVGDRGNPTFWAPRGHHSRKPLSFLEWVESTLPGPRLELYATGTRPNWTCWGHKTGYHLHEGGVTELADLGRPAAEHERPVVSWNGTPPPSFSGAAHALASARRTI